MEIHDIALLAECEQLFDVDAQIRHDVEVIVKDFRNLRIPDLSEYEKIYSAIISIIEDEYENEEYKDDWFEEGEFDQSDEEYE